MLLEISDAIWEMIVSGARKSLSLQTQWHSPKDKNPYQIRKVNNDKISIARLRGGEDSELVPGILKSQLGKINDNGGRLHRREFSTGVANLSTIVFLHPALSWSDDFEMVIASNGIAMTSNASTVTYPLIPNDEGDRQKIARKIRRGQHLFRQHLLKAYDKKCCITGCEVEAVLEAAHICDHAVAGINQPENGLLLRSDVHILFDKNLIIINTGTHTISVNATLTGTEYAEYQGCQIARRSDGIAISDTYLEMKATEKLLVEDD